MFLNCNYINFSYTDDKKVLYKISFDLEKGKTLAIVGASGCGKSTLLRILSGILPKAKEHSLQGNISIGGLTPDQYRQTGKLAFMFQEATLMPHLMIKQNIELPLKIKGNVNEQKTNNLIKAVGLEEYSNYLPRQLSGGMKTRVALARSFSTNPELLLLDEPFSALDIAWKSKLYVELEKLREETDTTVVMVTHDVQEAIFLADKIIVLGRNGIILNTTEIPSNIPKLNRVTNIANYNDSANFHELFSSIQKWILNDSTRKITTKFEADKIINEIQEAAGNDELERKLNDRIVCIHEFSNDKTYHEILFNSFLRGTPFFKHELIWDILSFENIDSLARDTIFDYYINNIESISVKAKNSFYKLDSYNYFSALLEKIKERGRHKNWVYLLDMYAASDLPEVLNYLTKVENGRINELNSPYAKNVAFRVKAKIINEKQDLIYTA